MSELPSILQHPEIETEVLELGSRSVSERFFHSGLGRMALSGLATLGLAGGLVASETSSAQADANHVYAVTGTGGEGVWLHSDPGLSDKDDLIKVIPEGAIFSADCMVTDTPIGSSNNPIWLYGHDEAGSVGFIADFYSSSHWNNENTLHQQGLPFCGEQAAAQDAPVKRQEGTVTAVGYDRDAAVRWARDHAKDTPPYDASCTQFVSQSLWAGGLPKDQQWTNEGEFGRVQKRPGTKSAWAVDHFLDYVQSKYPQSGFITLDGDDFRNNSIPEADEGDVIIYDWEGDGTYDHATIVTDIVGDRYPEVAEWSVYDGRVPTPYTERGWTYSEKSRTWLQDKFPNVIAYLLNIDTTQVGQF